MCVTIAEAVACVRAGQQDGISDIISYTAPNIWLAVSLLYSEQIGGTMTEIYHRAFACGSALHSPSDLRMWLCGIAYPILLSKPDVPLLRNGRTDSELFFRMLAALPREERTAVLLLCAEGCTAAQSAQILNIPEIEVKRAIRRARVALADQAKRERAFASDTVNTAWILDHMKDLREQQAQQTELFETVIRCVRSGEAFSEQTESPAKADTRNYFQKLFRSRRFR